MAVGIIIHISIGTEKRTEFFTDENIRIGSDDSSDLQIRTKQIEAASIWLVLEYSDGVFRVINFDKSLNFTFNGNSLRRFVAISDGDVIAIENTNVSFSFFSLESKSSLITTNREQPQIAPFIEAAALESAATPKRDDAKIFLREFVRELSREISWATKLIV
ncbi:MAG TPA: FHA domain-containing protein, partial [Pyrinomonadaceae bacterium]